MKWFLLISIAFLTLNSQAVQVEFDPEDAAEGYAISPQTDMNNTPNHNQEDRYYIQAIPVQPESSQQGSFQPAFYPHHYPRYPRYPHYPRYPRYPHYYPNTYNTYPYPLHTYPPYFTPHPSHSYYLSSICRTSFASFCWIPPSPVGYNCVCPVGIWPVVSIPVPGWVSYN